MGKQTLTGTPGTGQPTPAEKLLRPIQSFIKIEASGGILLMALTAVALIWANSPWAAAYNALWQTHFTIGLGSFILNKPLILWINDGLMAIFFFVVGLEIKREVLSGELSSLRKAALPISAAIGGMVVPAGIYVLIAGGSEGAAGWGIPMATDIAFALGVMALLGSRVPLSLKIFLTALAIVDDIGAVLVIALFYTAQISWFSLAVGGGFLLALIAANRLGVRHPIVYLLLGLGLWTAFLKSGVHATIAGVLLAMTIPARPRIDVEEFGRHSQNLLDRFRGASLLGDAGERGEVQQTAIHALEAACIKVESPLQRMEHALHPWITFFIIPVFALANAGVSLEGNIGGSLFHPVGLGIIFGLFFGKQLGITLFSWLAVKTGLAELPGDISWRQIYGTSCLAGIGFTMSLFIATLAFGDSPLLTVSKIGILAASMIAGVVGWSLLRFGRTGTPE